MNRMFVRSIAAGIALAPTMCFANAGQAQDCPERHSLAWCVSRLAALDGAPDDTTLAHLRKASGGKVNSLEDLRSATGIALSAGTATGFVSTVGGLSRGAGAGLLMLTALMPSRGVGADSNAIWTWLPEPPDGNRAATVQAFEAQLLEAAAAALPADLKIQRSPGDPAAGKWQYRQPHTLIRGGECERTGCVLLVDTAAVPGAEANLPDYLRLPTGRHFLVKANFEVRNFRIWGVDKEVKREATGFNVVAYYQTVSSRLPSASWFYVSAVAPWISPVPVVFNRGDAHWFVHDPAAPVGQVSATQASVSR